MLASPCFCIRVRRSLNRVSGFLTYEETSVHPRYVDVSRFLEPHLHCTPRESDSITSESHGIVGRGENVWYTRSVVLIFLHSSVKYTLYSEQNELGDSTVSINNVVVGQHIRLIVYH